MAGAHGKCWAQKRQVRTYFWLERAGNLEKTWKNGASQGRDWAVTCGMGEPGEDEPDDDDDDKDDDDDDGDDDDDEEEEDDDDDVNKVSRRQETILDHTRFD